MNNNVLKKKNQGTPGITNSTIDNQSSMNISENNDNNNITQ